MKPTEFKEQNVVFAKDQPEYMPLPALKLETPEGEVISCWRMSFKERIKVLFTGKVWISLMSFNKPLTPSYLSVNRKNVFSIPKDTIPFLFLWKSKKHAGNWFAIHWGKSLVYFIFKVRLNLKYNQWHAVIHLPFFTFSHNNTVNEIGLCFGKYYISLYHNR
jgi:hypothetical protein